MPPDTKRNDFLVPKHTVVTSLSVLRRNPSERNTRCWIAEAQRSRRHNVVLAGAFSDSIDMNIENILRLYTSALMEFWWVFPLILLGWWVSSRSMKGRVGEWASGLYKKD